MVAPNFTADNFKKKMNQRVAQPRGQSLGGLKPMVGSNGAIIAQHGAQGGTYMVQKPNVDNRSLSKDSNNSKV